MKTDIIKIKELPEPERPRERLIRNGAGALSNSELLAILLGSGDRNASAVMLAERLLSADSSGIRFLTECSPEELCSIKGVGPAKAAILMAAVELGRRIMTTSGTSRINIKSPDDVAALFMEKMRYLKKENFNVLLLNTKSEMIAVENVSVGSLSSAEAHPREVFSNALKRGAAGIILVHNHPSGNPEPSSADIKLTERLSEAGSILGIEVLDHIVIGDGIYVSMKGEKLF